MKSEFAPLRIAFVLPRYARGLFGGAEMHAGALADKLAEIGHEVEMLTTCAVDHFTWKNELPPGVEQIGRLLVRRFPADARDHGIFQEFERAIDDGLPLTPQEEELWLRNQVSSFEMEDYLSEHAESYDVIIPIPYLFGTTYFAYRACRGSVVPIPCLHDESYAYLAFAKEMLEGAQGFLFNTQPELDLAKRIAPNIAPTAVVGSMGFEPPQTLDPEGCRAKYGLPSSFILYLGRREGGKNVPLLIEYFLRYKKRHPGELALVFVGSGDVQLPTRPDVIELDLDWKDRDDLYAASTAFCLPSVKESLSIVIMQAWLASCPVIVNARCDVTREHCRQSNGGLWFGNYAEFEEVVGRLASNPGLRKALGANGFRYVRTRYSWEAVIDRVSSAIEEFTGRHAHA